MFRRRDLHLLQAQARCHRIGQNKMVKVYRLITRNSYEREMFDRASMKLGLDKAVLQSMGGEKIQPVSGIKFLCNIPTFCIQNNTIERVNFTQKLNPLL